MNCLRATELNTNTTKTTEEEKHQIYCHFIGMQLCVHRLTSLCITHIHIKDGAIQCLSDQHAKPQSGSPLIRHLLSKQLLRVVGKS